MTNTQTLQSIVNELLRSKEGETLRNKIYPSRYYSGSVNTKGAIVSVFGWYEQQEWTKVRLTQKTSLGWLVERI